MTTRGLNPNMVTFDEMKAFLAPEQDEPTMEEWLKMRTAYDEAAARASQAFSSVTLDSLESAAKKIGNALKAPNANRDTVGHWLAGDTDDYLPDLWGRAGALEPDGPKPKKLAEHNLMASGLGATVTIKCSCGWTWTGERDKAEKASGSHLTSPEGVRSLLEPAGVGGPHDVDIDVTEITDSMGRLGEAYRATCRTCKWRSTNWSRTDTERAAKTHRQVVDKNTPHTLSNPKPIHDRNGTLQAYQITCSCGWKHTDSFLQRVRDVSEQHVAANGGEWGTVKVEALRDLNIAIRSHWQYHPDKQTYELPKKELAEIAVDISERAQRKYEITMASPSGIFDIQVT